jgi:hypothetical protein
VRVSRLPVLKRLVDQLPAWAVALIAVICVIGGVVLTVRPFTSVEVLVVLVGINSVLTGALMLVSCDDAAPGRRVLIGVGWLVLGIAILAWPSLSVAALAVVIGVALVVSGLVDVVRVVAQRQRSERAAVLIGGLASIVFGVLALSWPDVTVLVVAVLFGARTVLFGLSQLFALVAHRRRGSVGGEGARPSTAPSRVRRGIRLLARVVALLVALALLGVSVLIHRGAPAEAGAFSSAPETIPTTSGVLLRSEPYTTGIPDDARAWLIL